MVNKHLNVLGSVLCFFIVIYVVRLVLINNEGFKTKATARKNTSAATASSAVLKAARDTKARIEKEKIIERERQRARKRRNSGKGKGMQKSSYKRKGLMRNY